MKLNNEKLNEESKNLKETALKFENELKVIFINN